MRLRDIAPRLAFQALPATTNQKVELVNRLVKAGLKAVEVSSFVNPKLVPGHADAEAVFDRVERIPGVSLECCVGSVSGIRRAIEAKADAAWFLLSADEEFARKNIGRSIDESFEDLIRMRDLAAGTNTKLGTYIIMTFGGLIGLPRDTNDIRPFLDRLVKIGITDWILADSCGYASPKQMREMVDFATSYVPVDQLLVQIHDSRGMGMANIAQLAQMGFNNIDTALAGSGGHPATPNARVGGTCTEDAVQMLELMGYDTGVDLDVLLDTSCWLSSILGPAALGFLRHAGKVPRTQRDVDWQASHGLNFQWMN